MSSREDAFERSVQLLPMEEAERDAFIDASIAAYAQSSVDAGRWTPTMAGLRAAALARRSAAERVQAGEHFLHVVGGGVRRGAVWLVPNHDELYLLKLVIYPAFRRQGWGRAAMRAVEALARERAARVLALNAYLSNPAGLALYASQAYTTAMQGMVKCLRDDMMPQVDGRLSVVAMQDPERDAFIQSSSATWADNMVRSGRWPQQSRDSRLALARRGLQLEDARQSQHFHTLCWASQACGVLWFDLDAGEAYVMELLLFETHRGRGIGRAAMAWVEGEAGRLGADTLALNVFADNARAIALYEGSGLRTVSYQLVKRIG